MLQFGPLGPAGLLGEWLEARRIGVTVHRADGDDPLPDPAEHGMVAVLGSRFNPADAHEPQVANGRAVVEQAVAEDVPVLGLCFGGQLLASVLGGRVEPAARPELGWQLVESDEPDLVAPGPWLSWHWHRFTTPPGATEIARNACGPQAFRHGRHLGVQFHPESTIEIVAGWAGTDLERLEREGVPDAGARLEEGREHAEPAAARAWRLFDGFVDHAGNGGEGRGAH